MMDKRERRELITARLKLAAFHSGMTLKEIAKGAGVSLSALESYLYSGMMPGADKLAALCEVMKASPAWVLGLSERRGMNERPDRQA